MFDRFISATIWKVAALIVIPAALAAQRVQPVRGLGTHSDDQLRLAQLSGDSALAGSLLRSVSTLAARLSDSTRTLAWALAPLQHRYTYNSDLPFSLNDGALWAGRGSNASITLGVRAEWGPVRFFLLPEFSGSENRAFRGPDVDPRITPPRPAARDSFSSPWHAGPQSIDLPWRFGPTAFGDLDWGQSSIIADVGRVSVGATTENEWWGPGIRNALILSNNAEGFPRVFVRTARPVETRVGIFEGRWHSGWLRESRYFDADPDVGTRSISMAAVTWQPPRSTVVIGAARAVFSPRAGSPRLLEDAFMVFSDVGHPNARPMSDSTMRPGRDQLFSLFWRWVEPKDRFEFYGEWARTEIPVSLRDWLVHPNHTQGYTLGLQWLGDTIAWTRQAQLRVQGEATFLEQSSTFRQRPIGSWYTSRAVEQGYTHKGQVIGAAIGPGSSSQFVAMDLIAPKWQAGAYLNRIRWLEDAHSQGNYDYDAGHRGMCEHDVSFLPGIRAAAVTKIGTIQADYSAGWRLNVFFEHPGTCFSTFPSGARDVHNKSLTLTFVPTSF
jgi:hypothetical protein